MAVPPVLSDLGLVAPNAPNRSGRDGRTATQISTRFRTTSRHQAQGPRCEAGMLDHPSKPAAPVGLLEKPFASPEPTESCKRSQSYALIGTWPGWAATRLSHAWMAG